VRPVWLQIASAVASVILLAPCTAVAADPPVGDELPNRIQGDLGAAVYATRGPIRGTSNSTLLLPYGYFDYGRFFARIDTLGIKTVPLGYGYLEVTGRIKLDGYKTSANAALRGINGRQDSIPIGISSFQLTPVGAFFLYAFRDVNLSQGNMYDVIYAAKFDLGKTALYPQAELEYFSAAYNRYYYGVSSAEAAASGNAAYTPGASVIPSLGLMLEVPLEGDWYSSAYVRRRWLGSAVTNSPLVNTGHQDTGFVTVNYRYE
jgi:outer membrane protein